jgi:hypothetical protein
MELVYTNIEIINGGDLILANRNIIGQDEVKSVSINILVDKKLHFFYINEIIVKELGLKSEEKRKWKLLDGSVVEYDVVGPIELKFKNRRCNVGAMVLPGDSEPLLGAIPMEDMPVRLPYLKLL